MQLNKFKAVAKPRNPWQAIDLGFVMARAWYWQLLVLWLVPAGMLYSVLVLFSYDTPYISALVVWWLKPIWERPILYVISRQLFDNHVPKKEVFKQYFQLIKFDALLWVSWRRLSVYRAFDMPVTQLEQLKGGARRSRLQLIHMRFSGSAAWLLITCVHVELFLLLGIGAGIALLIPQGVDPNWSLWFMNNSDFVSHIYNLFWLLSAALVAPFYVCAGFSLYLQRRIDLEAWDIEIQFRRLAQRKSARKRRVTLPSFLVFVCCLGLGSSHVRPVHAQASEYPGQVLDEPAQVLQSPDAKAPPADTSASPQQKAAKQAINEVFESDDFRNIEHSTGFRPIIEEQEDESQAIPEWLIALAEWLEGGGAFFKLVGEFFLWLAKAIEFILWGLVACLIGFLIFYYRSFIFRVFNYREEEAATISTPPKTMFGLDVTESGLPKDVVDAAQKIWAQGDQRLALAMLLRGSIVKCIELRCDFASGNTEKECAQIVASTLEKTYVEYFSRLVKHWHARAYAHKHCKPEVFETLCRQWREVFANG